MKSFLLPLALFFLAAVAQQASAEQKVFGKWMLDVVRSAADEALDDGALDDLFQCSNRTTIFPTYNGTYPHDSYPLSTSPTTWYSSPNYWPPWPFSSSSSSSYSRPSTDGSYSPSWSSWSHAAASSFFPSSFVSFTYATDEQTGEAIVPARREPGEPWVRLVRYNSMDSDKGRAEAQLLRTFSVMTSHMNLIGSMIESLTGHPLRPLAIGVAQSEDDAWVSYEVSTGHVRLHREVFALVNRYISPKEMESLMSRATDNFHAFAETQREEKDVSTSALIKLAADIPVIVAESVWFCLACTVILAIGLPFLFNFALGDLADFLCKCLALSESACLDLIQAAIGLAYALLFPAALVVIKVCGLETCEEHSTTTADNSTYSYQYTSSYPTGYYTSTYSSYYNYTSSSAGSYY